MKRCVICKNQGKYKCPVCRIEYCSAECFKIHKEKCSALVIIPSDIVNKDNDATTAEEKHFTEDTVSLEKLKLLERDEQVKHLLENPHLRDFIKEIDKSSDPEKVMQKAMMEPIFVEFVDACLNVVEETDSV